VKELNTLEGDTKSSLVFVVTSGNECILSPDLVSSVDMSMAVLCKFIFFLQAGNVIV
jgi:hypothetical protein